MPRAIDTVNAPSLIISQGSGNPVTYATTSETVTGIVDPDPIGIEQFEIPGGYSGGAFIRGTGTRYDNSVLLAPAQHNIITIVNPYTRELLEYFDISEYWLTGAAAATGDFSLYASEPQDVWGYDPENPEGATETPVYAIQTLRRFAGATHVPFTTKVILSPSTWFFQGSYADWSNRGRQWRYSLMFGIFDLNPLATERFKFLPVDLEPLLEVRVPDKWTNRIFTMKDAVSASNPTASAIVNKTTLVVRGSTSGSLDGASAVPYPGVRNIFTLDGNPRPDASYMCGSPAVGETGCDHHQIFQAGGCGLLAQDDFVTSQVCVSVLLESRDRDASSWTARPLQAFASEATTGVLLSQVIWPSAGSFVRNGKDIYVGTQFARRKGHVPFQPASQVIRGMMKNSRVMNLLKAKVLGATDATDATDATGTVTGTPLPFRTISGPAKAEIDLDRGTVAIVYKTGIGTFDGNLNQVTAEPTIFCAAVGIAEGTGGRFDAATPSGIIAIDVVNQQKFGEGVVTRLSRSPNFFTSDTFNISAQSQVLCECDWDPTIATTTISFAPEGIGGWEFNVGHPVGSGATINTDNVMTLNPTWVPTYPDFYNFKRNKSFTFTREEFIYRPPTFGGAAFYFEQQSLIRTWLAEVKKDEFSEISEELKYPDGFFLYRMQGNPVPLKTTGYLYPPGMCGNVPIVYDPYAQSRNVILGSDLEVQRARLWKRPVYIVDENTSRKTLSAYRIEKPVSFSRPSSMQKCGQVFRLEQRRFPTATDKAIIPCYFRGQETTPLREATTPDYTAITPASLGVGQGSSGIYLVPYNPRSKQKVTHRRIIIDSNATTRFFLSDSRQGMFVSKGEAANKFTEATAGPAGE